MYNKKVIIKDANLTIAANLKSSYKYLNSVIFHKIYHMANMKTEAL